MATLPNARVIRAAILAAPPRPTGFPLQSLRDPKERRALREVPHLQHMLQEIRAEAQRANASLVEPLTFDLFHLFETTGERAAYERVYFDRRRRLVGLALATVIDETDTYIPGLNNVIWEICNEYTWALPAHLRVGIDAVEGYRVPPEQVVDLFAAETAQMLAEALSVLDGMLDPWLQYRIRNEVERRVFRPVFHDPRQFEWESAPMNWAAVCGGGIGIAALVLISDRERLIGMIDRVVRTLSCFLDGFGADGGCAEGIGYWAYGFGYYTYFAEALRDYTGGALDLLQNEHVRHIAAFPQAISLGGGKYINYSDAAEQATIFPGLGSRLMSRLGRAIPDLHPPDFDSDHVSRWGNITRDVVWTEAAYLHTSIHDGTAYLSDLGWVVDRRTLNGRTVAFSAKGGHNDEPHNHNDLGHFILHLGGESLLADLGPGVYTRQYFGAERYESPHTGSQGHSVPLINGQTQHAGAQYTASVLTYAVHPDGVEFALDLTRAYADPALESFVRVFYWSVNASDGSALLRLTDTFRFNTLPAMVEECFISRVQPSLEGETIRWTGQNAVVELKYDTRQFEAAVDALETQPHQAAPITVYRLRLRTQTESTAQSSTFEFACH